MNKTRSIGALALALALLCATGSNLAAAAEPEPPDLYGYAAILEAKATLKAKKLGSLKVPVVVGILLSHSDWWAQDDDLNEFVGSYRSLDTKGRKFTVTFAQQSVQSLAGVLEDLVLDEAGLSAQVVSITQRPAILSTNKKRTRATLKLIFDITAYVNGEYRIATYKLSLKGELFVAPTY